MPVLPHLLTPTTKGPKTMCDTTVLETRIPNLTLHLIIAQETLRSYAIATDARLDTLETTSAKEAAHA